MVELSIFGLLRLMPAGGIISRYGTGRDAR